MINSSEINAETCRTPLITQPQSGLLILICTLFPTAKPQANNAHLFHERLILETADDKELFMCYTKI